MKELIEFIASYPIWVKLTTVALATAIVLLLIVFKPVTSATKESDEGPDSLGTMDTPGAEILVVGHVQAEANGSTFLDISTGGSVERVPITLIIDVPRKDPRGYDFSILFDVTNTAPTDLRIVDVFVRTIEWHELEQIVRYIPLAGLGETRQFFCVLDKEDRLYRAHYSDSGKYLRLKPGELETIELAVSAFTEGKYTVQVVIEYSVAGKIGKTVIGPIQDIRFLDQGRIYVLPR